jgi:hypothetical protein
LKATLLAGDDDDGLTSFTEDRDGIAAAPLSPSDGSSERVKQANARSTVDVQVEALGELLKTTTAAASQCTAAVAEVKALDADVFDSSAPGRLRDRMEGKVLKEKLKLGRVALERTRSALLALVQRRSECTRDLANYSQQIQHAAAKNKRRMAECNERLESAKKVKREIATHLSSIPSEDVAVANDLLLTSDNLFDDADSDDDDDSE